MVKQKPLLFLVFLCFALPLSSQIKSPSAEFGFNAILSNGPNAPFWLISNRQGKFLPDNNAVALGLGLFAAPDSGKVFDYHYGFDVHGRLSESGQFWLHQAYAGLIYRGFAEFRAGIWEEIIGSREPGLSSGSIIWSGNARPVPKVQIGTPGYVDLPYTRGYAEVSGLLSHGWFIDDRYVSNVLLHHKNIYFRLGGSLPVNIYYGFNHYAQWGGQSPDYDKPFPSDLDAYYRIFFNRSGDPDNPAYPETWVRHKYGNTLGSRNYGIDLKLASATAGIYFQDVFEDGSGLRRKNFPDGLWGVFVRLSEENSFVNAMLYEFLHTKYQSGSRHNDEHGNIIGGNDDYFNHEPYHAGWTNHQFTIGTPLITSPVFQQPDQIPFGYIINNRVIAHHLGFEGGISEETSYRSLITYSRNYGRYRAPIDPPIDQLSWMLELTRSLPWLNLEANITLAGDLGRMYGDNWGIMIGLRRLSIID